MLAFVAALLAINIAHAFGAPGEAAERDGAGDPVRLQELVEIGEMLKLAMQMSKPGPRTLGHIAAWRWADEATRRLGALVGAHTLTGECVSATAKAMAPKR